MASSKAFSKMKLVPVDPSIPPASAKVSDLGQSMVSVLQQRGESNDSKLKRFRELLMDYLHYLSRHGGRRVDGVAPQSSPLNDSGTSHGSSHDGASYHSAVSIPDIAPDERPIADISHQHVDDIITTVTTRPDIINFSPQGELVYHGVTIPNTDFLNLIGGLDGEGREMFDEGVQEILRAPFHHTNDRYSGVPLPPSPDARRRIGGLNPQDNVGTIPPPPMMVSDQMTHSSGRQVRQVPMMKGALRLNSAGVKKRDRA